MSDLILADASSAAGTTLTINRPEHGNQLTLDMIRSLTAYVRASAARPGARYVLIRGAGADFSHGRDPGAPPAARPSAMQIRDGVTQPILDFYAAVREAKVPVLAAVRGAAFGFGCAVASCCDVVIAADDARFRLPEMEKNLPPTLAISATLQRVAPKTVAYLVLSLEEIDADTALKAGIVSIVVPLAGLDAAIERLIATLATRSPMAVRAVKQYLRTAPYMEPQGAADFAGSLLAAVLASPEP